MKLGLFSVSRRKKEGNMFGTAVRCLAKKSKPKMGPIVLKTPPEQRNTITRVLFDIVKEHGPITVANTWDRVKVISCIVMVYCNVCCHFDMSISLQLQHVIRYGACFVPSFIKLNTDCH